MGISDVQVKRKSYKEQKALMMFKSSNSMDQSVDIKGKPVNMYASGRWRAVRFLIAAEILEKIAFLAIASNIITYLTKQLHEGTGTSSINVYNWLGASFFLTILGGFIADTSWGRYWTMINFSCLYLLGMFVLTLAETIKALKPPPCDVKLGKPCAKATSKEVGFFWLALVLVAISFNGTAPARAPLCVDQFDKEVPIESSMLLSFSNRWFVCLSFGALVAHTSIIYIQDNSGWGVGFALPTVGYAFNLVLMLCGMLYYRHKVPTGSPLTAIAQVLVAAARNHTAAILLQKRSMLFDSAVVSDSQEKREPAETCHRLEHIHSLTFLDRAAFTKPSTEENTSSFDDSEPTNLWKRCPVSQVEDVKQLVRLLPLWLILVPVTAVQAQLVTFFTLQDHTLQSRIFPSYNFNIPPASLQCATTATFLLCILLYARVEKRHVTPLQRTGAGTVLSVLAMVVAATTEAKRLKEVMNHGMLDKPHQVGPMSILWLLPQYILMGLVEVSLTIGQLELFYEEAPPFLHSMGNILFLTNTGAGNFWASAMVKLVMATTGGKLHTHQQWIVNENINQCRLDYFFWFLAIQTAFVACLYMVIAQRFQKSIRLEHHRISACHGTCKDGGDQP